jgi:hypothetical protein
MWKARKKLWKTNDRRTGEMPDSDKTVTVITEDSAYQIKADGWEVNTNSQLDVTSMNDDGDESRVASFAPTKWIAVMLDESVTETDA